MRRVIAASVLAIGAILMAAALLSSSVDAEGGNEVHIGATPAVITGISTFGTSEVFTFQDSEDKPFTVTCNLASLEGKTTTATATQVTLTPKYYECKYGESTVTIKMNGCRYRWDWSAKLTADWNIVSCPTTKLMEIVLGPKCVISFPAQGTTPHIVFQNVGTPIRLEAVSTITKIAYQYLGTGCPGADKEDKNDGELSGTTAVRAFQLKDEELLQDPVSGHQYTAYIHDGKQQVELKST
jgi:hypothetical protein